MCRCFEDSVIMFQDTFGNRYLDVEYTKEPVLDEKELEENALRCIRSTRC